MISFSRLLAGALLLAVVARDVEGGVLFSSLKRTLAVDAQIQRQNASTGVAKVGDDHLAVQCRLNSSFAQGVDAEYASVKMELCFAPVSQTDRGWRKTKDDLHTDKTCLKEIATQRYSTAGNSVVWKIPKDVPGAFYFVRVYVLSAEGVELAYGQSTNNAKTFNLIRIIPITGRHAVMDIAGIVFSLFSVASLCSFLAADTVSARKSAAKS